MSGPGKFISSFYSEVRGVFATKEWENLLITDGLGWEKGFQRCKRMNQLMWPPEFAENLLVLF
jgi:hypothetical protein